MGESRLFGQHINLFIIILYINTYPLWKERYSGLNLNQYGVASPCRTICTVCGFVALS
ncbi:hypothetical protein NEIMUCOT_04665 [Neisseria mucosa ATCC 25996]|uniref:Uncharacterized protein n=1 Tax=Neisseria mucosa (strain ATCC 25996 / DSM 4631 / NCTC 10774 / M26) TaxID=546266 RepID=D2ZVM2_NEIM2|nr:hypothetical protein NEIMUCOT_04665 [Neisseria mucosa ATCC 25996]